MKVNEVPQDEAFLKEGKIRDLCYVVDKDGHYTKVLSKGWEPKNEAIRLAWKNIYEQASVTREKVLAGIKSPVAYYMQINIMDVHILADYMDISVWRVKRHLKMKVFRKLSTDILSKYAELFGISVEALINIDNIKDHKPNNED